MQCEVHGTGAGNLAVCARSRTPPTTSAACCTLSRLRRPPAYLKRIDDEMDRDGYVHFATSRARPRHRSRLHRALIWSELRRPQADLAAWSPRQSSQRPGSRAGPAIRRPRRTRLRPRCAPPACARLPPSQPRPSRVGMPIAPVKFPSEPPPALLWLMSMPSSIAARELVERHGAPSGSHTGRVTPRSTVMRSRLPVVERKHALDPAIQVGLALRHAQRLARHTPGHAVDPLAARITPTEKVQSSWSSPRSRSGAAPSGGSPSGLRRGARRHGSACRGLPG